jgi:hypothetical protein
MDIEELGAQYELPPSTARGIWKKWQQTGSTHTQRGPASRRKVSFGSELEIVALALESRSLSLTQIGRQLNPPVLRQTVHDVLHKHDIHRRHARKVPRLTAQHCANRLEWVHNHQGWIDEWDWVCWSDECYIVLGDKKGVIWITRDDVSCIQPQYLLSVDVIQDEDPYIDECTVPSDTQSSVHIMVWGCMMRHKKGPLVVLEYPGGRGGGMNAERYIEQVLKGALSDFYLKAVQEYGDVVFFQQDNTRSHTAKQTKTWLDKREVRQLDHPANSPDLSPIERGWYLLKQRIRNRPHAPTSFAELRNAALEEWDNITAAELTHYTDMSGRIAAVIKAEGGHTKY